MSIKIQKTDIKNICDLYKSGLSAPKIAKRYDVSNGLILECLEKNDIKRRNPSECHRIYPINESFFDEIDTEEKAYFLGFLYADGGNIKSGNFVRIELQKQDANILYKFAELIYKENSEKHIKYYTRTRNLGAGLKEYYSCYLNINSKHVCNILEQHGCGPAKTANIVFPKWLAPKLHRHFIRGYFDGDGNIRLGTNSARFKITSTELFAKTIKKIIEENVEINMSIYLSTKSSFVFDAISTGNRQVLKIMKWLYQDATIFLERKHSIYLKLIEKIENTNRLILKGTQGYSKRYLYK